MKPGVLTIEHPDVGTTITVPVHDLAAATPSQLVAYLVGEGQLPAPDPQRPYEMFHSGKSVPMAQNFAASGVLGDATVRVLRATHGANDAADR